MPVVCELNPRQDLTPEQHKQLGKALEEWASRERRNVGLLCMIDQAGLDSLLSGEPPNPLGLRAKQLNEGVSWEKIRQDLGPVASDRSLRFSVKDEPGYSREKVIESLREAIPTELVDDILIDEVSWTE